MSITPLLKCADLEATKAFYATVLGFEVCDSAEATCTVQLAGGTMIFTAQDLWPGAPACTGTIYFSVPNVDEYYSSVRDRATVRWPLENMPYGTREFAVADCNGYTLGFAEHRE